ncbi:CCA tRNA nucleotidyltransferase [Synechococcus sp. UW69]|uniref:CCA tRNA nucleotidyltransferase n=1 Tax=Synechococcus sp. UW69 TaxID=368493 RepID=UPI000E0EF9F2|nr:CCA tRNA nucleotidyltransferase [Synechococcus sp. UW69]
MDLPGVPSSVLEALKSAARSLGIPRLALVGGVVRDQLLLQRCAHTWSDIPDLDWVVEGDAAALVAELIHQLGSERINGVEEHGAFGTVTFQLDGISVDLATARREHYPAPAENPIVRLGTLQADLARRDFTINAMALDVVNNELIDLHDGQKDLVAGQLKFLHSGSVQDDPTRVIRAARYAARLGFELAGESREQIRITIEKWPWNWSQGDEAFSAPPALASRMRMELGRLLEREPWAKAFDLLEEWGALTLLDPQLQTDQRRTERLRWAQRLDLPLMPALLVAATDPVAIAQRLQIHGKQQKWVQQCGAIRDWLVNTAPSSEANPSIWSTAIEQQGWEPEAVALAVSLRPVKWKPLLRWWGRWRRIQAPQTARELIAEGWQPGPGIGEELRKQRKAAQDLSR